MIDDEAILRVVAFLWAAAAGFCAVWFVGVWVQDAIEARRLRRERAETLGAVPGFDDRIER